MKQVFRIKLGEQHTANENQIIDGYLAEYGNICLYSSRGEANKKAKMFGGKVEPFGLKYGIDSVKLIQIYKGQISSKLLFELDGRAVYADTDDELKEHIYAANVFEAILGELSEIEKINNSSDKELENELLVLDVICRDYEYVQLTTL